MYSFLYILLMFVSLLYRHRQHLQLSQKSMDINFWTTGNTSILQGKNYLMYAFQLMMTCHCLATTKQKQSSLALHSLYYFHCSHFPFITQKKLNSQSYDPSSGVCTTLRVHTLDTKHLTTLVTTWRNHSTLVQCLSTALSSGLSKIQYLMLTKAEREFFEELSMVDGEILSFLHQLQSERFRIVHTHRKFIDFVEYKILYLAGKTVQRSCMARCLRRNMGWIYICVLLGV